MIQAHIFYSGTVHGVGFRYTVQNFAKEFGLVGWVKNLRDGRVEILVEGSKDVIDQLMNRVEDNFGEYIRGKEIEIQSAQGQLKDFRITY